MNYGVSITLAIWTQKMNTDSKEMTRKSLLRKVASVAILAPAALLAACATQPTTVATPTMVPAVSSPVVTSAPAMTSAPSYAPTRARRARG